MTKLLILLKFQILTLSALHHNLDSDGRCIPIISDNTFCGNFNVYYNSTFFPNRFNHQNQNDALIDLRPYWTEVDKNNCHKLAKLFFCISYIPICPKQDNVQSQANIQNALSPCSEFCTKIKNSCESRIKKGGLQWPDNLNCRVLPKFREDVCVNYPADISKLNGKTNHHNGLRILEKNCTNNPVQCPADLKISSTDQKISRNRYTFLTTRDNGVAFCGAPCNSNKLFWTSDDRWLVRVLIAIFSAISIVTTTFAIATYLTESNRFRYPEKPIIWLAGCYFFISISYLAGALTSNEIACTTLEVGESNKGQKSIISQGTDRTSCTLSFMLLYFFTIAAGVWWVILALTWLLAAGLKWSSEAIERISQYFHFCSWGLPTVLTLIILSQGKVEGDSLSGVCFVGQLDSAGLYSYVFLPLSVCLFLGCLFLVMGFVALFRIRKNFKRSNNDSGMYSANQDQNDTGTPFDQKTSIQKLEALILKIGMFSLGYAIPASIVLACYYYETQNYDNWIKSWVIQKSKDNQSTNYSYCELNKSDLNKNPENPLLGIFLVKYLVTLVLGTICGLWVWSMKTIYQWFGICGCNDKVPNSHWNSDIYGPPTRYQSGTRQQRQSNMSGNRNSNNIANRISYSQGMGNKNRSTHIAGIANNG